MKVIYCMLTSLLLCFYIIHVIYIVMYHHMVTLGDITMHTNEFLVTLTHYDGNPCIFPPMIFTSTIWAMQETVKRTSTIAVVQWVLTLIWIYTFTSLCILDRIIHSQYLGHGLLTALEVCIWEELISRTHRTNSEQCSKMLQHWVANVESRSEPRQLLAETLLNLGCTRLAEFLTTEADPDLFMWWD